MLFYMIFMEFGDIYDKGKVLRENKGNIEGLFLIPGENSIVNLTLFNGERGRQTILDNAPNEATHYRLGKAEKESSRSVKCPVVYLSMKQVILSVRKEGIYSKLNELTKISGV